ncbi:DUF4123 domain-containing protein [Photobacterium japonica]|uniref:DUF4123 domain-containing protein n=1 Tax=Photobacterium japonica TaxID=2910235 RepID=UPI003D0F2425
MKMVHQPLPKPIPQLYTELGEYLYLLLDGSQIESLEDKLKQLPFTVEYEVIYNRKPWSVLREVTPIIAKCDLELAKWFLTTCGCNQGYFVTSKKALPILIENYQSLIEVKSPYDSVVLFKIAHSEAAWILYDDENSIIWNDIESVWIPTREGWKNKKRPSYFKDISDKSIFQLTNEHWYALGEVSWRNTLCSIKRHMEKWFQHQLPSDQDLWIQVHANRAYSLGFQSERDLLLFFTVIGYLSDNVLINNLYLDIRELIEKPSRETPSQRIEKAALLAEKYANQ